MTGAVDSIVPYLEQPCVVTLPIAIGSGTRLKIVEAFAVGRPVVSSAKGAEGIDAVDGEHLLLATARGDGAAVIDLWSSPAMRGTICKSALELARVRYSWSAATDRSPPASVSMIVQPNFGAGERAERSSAYADGTVH